MNREPASITADGSAGARLGYRADIDGLRAVAVMAVVLFHLGVPWLQGGYVGVDVFFVISGYLITKLIVSEITTTGRIDYRAFYERRVRRLFPALFATIAATLAFGVIVLDGALLRELLSEGVFGVASVSNCYFWAKSGYFDSESVGKPLLHLWSLSAEEQFYLFWPVIVAVSTRSAKVWAAALIIGGLAALSFAANLVLARAGETSAIFFLTPFRIFEFAIGAGVVWTERRAITSRLVHELGLVLGLLMIAGAAVVFSQDTVFPSTNALVPCVGAALVISFGRARYVGSLLRNEVARSIGLISYSLYLVHWPVIVFFRLFADRTPGPLEAVGLLAGVFAGAYVMYRLVEERFRIRARAARRVSFAVFGVTSVGLALALVTTAFALRIASSSAAGAIDPDAVVAEGQRYSWTAMRRLRGPWLDHGHRTLLVGDSQAADFLNLLLAFDDALASSIRTAPSDKFCQIKSSAAFYASGDYKDAYTPPPGQLDLCERDRTAFAADRRVETADDIILAYAWYRTAGNYLQDDVAAIRARNPRARIFLVGRKDQPKSSLAYLEAGVAPDAAAVAARRDAVAEVTAVNTQLAAQPGVSFLDLYGVMCARGRCELFTESGAPVLFEPRHLTPIGAKFVSRGVRFWRLVAVPLGLDRSDN